MKPEELKDHELSVYCRVFFARVQHGASVEAADRQALHAVKIWRERAAFDEPEQNEDKGAARSHGIEPTCFDIVADWVEDRDGLDEFQLNRLAVVLREIVRGDLDYGRISARLSAYVPDGR
jgi:hypothetical protein